MIYILNALPLGACGGDVVATSLHPRSVGEFRDARSAVGHADFARAASTLLGFPVAFNRETIRLEPGDEALVLAYSGPRLQEGTTVFPAEGEITLWRVRVRPQGTDAQTRDEAGLYREALAAGRIVRRFGINGTNEDRAVELGRLTEMLAPRQNGAGMLLAD